MPYSSTKSLPEAVQKLPEHGQAIYMAAFNAILAAHPDDESRAHAGAWAAVKEQYEQDASGAWKAKAKTKEAAPDAYSTRVAETIEAGAVLEASPIEGSSDVAFRLLAIRLGETKCGKRTYTEACLREAACSSQFDNLKLYKNHSGPADQARGHRDLGDWWATTLTEGAAQFVESLPDGSPGGLVLSAIAHHDEARNILNSPMARTAMQFSHDSDVRYRPSKQNGRHHQVVEAIERCHSVDFVPYGNAGGRLTEAASAERVEEISMDQEAITAIAAAFAEVMRPTFARIEEALASKSAPKPEPEEDPEDGEQITEALTRADVDKMVKRELREAHKAWEKGAQAELDKRDTRDAVREALEKTPDCKAATKLRIMERFADMALPEDEREAKITEAITDEIAYQQDVLKEYGVRPAVRGAGPTVTPLTQRAKEAEDEARRAYQREHGFSEDDIKRLEEVG